MEQVQPQLETCLKCLSACFCPLSPTVRPQSKPSHTEVQGMQPEESGLLPQTKIRAGEGKQVQDVHFPLLRTVTGGQTR